MAQNTESKITAEQAEQVYREANQRRRAVQEQGYSWNVIKPLAMAEIDAYDQWCAALRRTSTGDPDVKYAVPERLL